MSLWANILEVIWETLIVIVILISYGNNSLSYIKRPGIEFLTKKKSEIDPTENLTMSLLIS